MFDFPPNVPWLLAWVMVPLILGVWLILGWWHCFSSDRDTGVLLLLCVVFATWLILFRWGYPWRLPQVSSYPLPQFEGLGFVLGWVVGCGGTALVVADRAYRSAKHWPQEYADRLRDAKRARRQQGISVLGALQLLVVVLLLFGYLAATLPQNLIYSLTLGTLVGVLLFLFVWQYREP